MHFCFYAPCINLLTYLLTGVILPFKIQGTSGSCGQLEVHFFSTRLLSSCTDEYAHTYNISTY